MSKVTKGMSTATPVVKGSVAAAKKAKAKMSITSQSSPAPQMDYAAHSDHSTLMEAEHIKADPAKMSKVRKVAGRKLMAATAINSIADIKAAGKKLRAGVSMAGKYPAGEMDMDGMEHHSTLERAEMIKSDPKRMAAVKSIAMSKMQAAHNVHKMVADMDEDKE